MRDQMTFDREAELTAIPLIRVQRLVLVNL